MRDANYLFDYENISVQNFIIITYSDYCDKYLAITFVCNCITHIRNEDIQIKAILTAINKEGVRIKLNAFWSVFRSVAN